MYKLKMLMRYTGSLLVGKELVTHVLRCVGNTITITSLCDMVNRMTHKTFNSSLLTISRVRLPFIKGNIERIKPSKINL